MIPTSLNAVDQNVCWSVLFLGIWCDQNVSSWSVGHNLTLRHKIFWIEKGQRKSLFGCYLVYKRSRRREYEYRGHSYIHWKIAQCHVTLSNLSSDSWTLQNFGGFEISSYFKYDEISKPPKSNRHESISRHSMQVTICVCLKCLVCPVYAVSGVLMQWQRFNTNIYIHG